MDCLDSITSMFSRGANLSVSEVTKVAVRNGMNGEFTRVICYKLRSETQKARVDQSPVYGAYIVFKSITLNRH